MMAIRDTGFRKTDGALDPSRWRRARSGTGTLVTFPVLPFDDHDEQRLMSSATHTRDRIITTSSADRQREGGDR